MTTPDPEKKPPSTRYLLYTYIAVFETLIGLVFPVLDGGAFGWSWLLTIPCFWFLASWILWKRGTKLTVGDKLYLTITLPLLMAMLLFG